MAEPAEPKWLEDALWLTGELERMEREWEVAYKRYADANQEAREAEATLSQLKAKQESARRALVFVVRGKGHKQAWYRLPSQELYQYAQGATGLQKKDR